ncbi:hypothetical protein HUG17_6700 [Dermatophagoides farinae]|uniref:Uncharacterized protein n=1 Tax=Dermatophagoides farinae TaxID=6954 RepID=A0A9D4P5F4_DERFA|nr:hypothetical protein HUG17_6700 [Dermatophagoides farinae]
MGITIHISSNDDYLQSIWPLIMFYKKNAKNVDKLFILNKHRNQLNDTELLYTLRYPYKSVYGLSNTLNCSQSIWKRFYDCERSSHQLWRIHIERYFYATKEFCCFIWNTLECEMNVAAECNVEYSRKLKNNTFESFEKICNKIYCGYNSFACWFSPDKQETYRIVAIIGVFILGICCTICGMIQCRNSPHTGLKITFKKPPPDIKNLENKNNNTTTIKQLTVKPKIKNVKPKEIITTTTIISTKTTTTSKIPIRKSKQSPILNGDDSIGGATKNIPFSNQSLPNQESKTFKTLKNLPKLVDFITPPTQTTKVHKNSMLPPPPPLETPLNLLSPLSDTSDMTALIETDQMQQMILQFDPIN